MKQPDHSKYFVFTLLALFLFFAATIEGNGQDLEINGLFSADKANQGRAIKAAVVVDIPKGLYVNGNTSLSKYVIPAALKIEAERGIKVGTATFPRAKLRSFKFSKEQFAVFENRIVIRFNITIPASFAPGLTTINVRLKYQTCGEQGCNPPQTRNIPMPISVVKSGDPVKRINGQIFAGR